MNGNVRGALVLTGSFLIIFVAIAVSILGFAYGGPTVGMPLTVCAAFGLFYALLEIADWDVRGGCKR